MSNGSPAQNIRTLQVGEYLCFQGEESNEVFVLRSGSLNIYITGDEGVATKGSVETDGMLVGVIDQPGSFIGEIGAILKEPRSASIMAADGGAQVMIIDLRGRGFDGTVMSNPKLGFSLSKTIAQRLGITSQSIRRIDSMMLKAKGYLEEVARSIYDLACDIEKASEGKEQPKVLADIKVSRPYQIGRLVEKYGTLPADYYDAMGLPLGTHQTVFKNRIAQGARAGTSPEASGEPKPGVAAFQPGTEVCQENNIDKHMYFLLAGKLELFVGSHTLEVIADKGAIFGENAMFGEMARSSGVRALTEVHAMPIPAASIEPFLMQKPPLVLHTLKMFAKRLPILNSTMMSAARQMGLAVDLLGVSPSGCFTFAQQFVPRIIEETAGLGEQADLIAHKAEGILSDLESGFEMISGEYEELCTDIGFKPKPVEAKAAVVKIAAEKINFATKVEEMETLDCEHMNFALNPKTDAFRACGIEYGHTDMLKQAKVAEASWKEFIFGSVINYGESFPKQFLIVDSDTGGLQQQQREYVLRALKWYVEKSEQEAVLIFRNKKCIEAMYVPDHVKLETEELVDEATIMGIIEAFRKKPDDQENLGKLNNLYWDLVVNIVQKKLPKVKDNRIPFEDKEMSMINFGLIDTAFIPDNSNVLNQIEEDKTFEPGEDHPLQYIYLTDLLQEVYYEEFGQKKLDQLEKIKKAAEGELQNCDDRIKALIKGRIDLVNSFPSGQAAAKMVQQLDTLITSTASLEKKLKGGGQISNEERAKIGQIKNMKAQLVAAINNYFISIKGRVSEEQLGHYRSLGEELEKRVIMTLSLQDLVVKRRDAITQQLKDMKGVTVKQKENAYKNEVIRIKKYVVMTAKKAQVDATAVLVGVRDIATKTRIKTVIDGFLAKEVDPEIFDPKLQRIKQLGIPRVMLVPGNGNAVYDWEKHLFIVPLQSPKSIEESVASGFVEFHWDMDEDKSMRESYGQLKVYKSLSITKLKTQLCKDYVTWATQEAKGWKKLDKEVRPWFQVKIAKQKLDK